MAIRDPQKGIDICQSNGKRLYDDAIMLRDSKRYHSAISLFILSYEEFGKARYLCLQLLKKEEIEEIEFDKLKDSGKAHTRKILVDPLAIGDMLENDSPEKYERRKIHAAAAGMPFIQLDRSTALKLHKDSMKIFGRLHNLKMAMLYVDYDGSWQSPKRFSDAALSQVCEYLQHEVIRVYHNNRLNVFQLQNFIGEDYTEISESQSLLIKDNPDKQAIVALDKVYHTLRFMRCLNITKTILDSL